MWPKTNSTISTLETGMNWSHWLWGISPAKTAFHFTLIYPNSMGCGSSLLRKPTLSFVLSHNWHFQKLHSGPSLKMCNNDLKMNETWPLPSRGHRLECCCCLVAKLCLTLFFFNFFIIIIFFLLYNIVLVLPYINMHPPWVYKCSPSWTPLPAPSPYHPSGSSQCTSPKLPVSCIEPGRLTLCNPMDCNPPGSSVHGIFQARILEWIAISFSRLL